MTRTAGKGSVARTYWAAGTAVGLALLFAVGATVATAGDTDSAPAASRTPGLHSADAGFARDMAVHHQQAVEMSFIVRDRTKDDAVRSLAYDIANTQANQRGMLHGWLDMWGLPKTVADEPPMSWMGTGGASHGAEGHAIAGAVTKPGALMPGMATKEDLAQLGSAEGRDAEVLYLRLMTDHHKGGVAMAQGCADQCANPAERALAQGMVDAQQSELQLMADMLKQRGAEPLAAE